MKNIVRNSIPWLVALSVVVLWTWASVNFPTNDPGSKQVCTREEDESQIVPVVDAQGNTTIETRHTSVCKEYATVECVSWEHRETLWAHKPYQSCKEYR